MQLFQPFGSNSPSSLIPTCLLQPSSPTYSLYVSLYFLVLCDRYAFAHVLLLLEMPSPPSMPPSPNSSSHISSFGKPLQILPTPVGSKPLLPWNSHGNLSVTHLLGTTTSSVCDHYNYRCIFLLSLRAKRCVWSTVTAPKNVSE